MKLHQYQHYEMDGIGKYKQTKYETGKHETSSHEKRQI